MKLNKKQIDIIFLGLIILVLLFMIFVVYYMITNKEAFLENPFLYGVSKMNGEIHCSCRQTIDEQRFIFEFNKTDWWSKPVEQYWF